MIEAVVSVTSMMNKTAVERREGSSPSLLRIEVSGESGSHGGPKHTDIAHSQSFI